jgi:excisionase family DNA binding protein
MEPRTLPERMYTAAEVATLLRLHPVVVRAKCARGEFPAVKISGNRWRIPAAYVDGVL